MKFNQINKLIFSIICLLTYFGGFTQTALVTITNTGLDTICSGSSISLLGNSNSATVSNWAWQSNPSSGVVIAPDTAQQNISVTFNFPGTYTLTLFVTDAVSTKDTFRVIEVKPFVTPAVSISAQPSTAICQGDSIVFTCSSTNQGCLLYSN